MESCFGGRGRWGMAGAGLLLYGWVASCFRGMGWLCEDF